MSTNWQLVLEGPKWIPVLEYAETLWQIPHELLCRVAYQESRFRPEIILGTDTSPAGALGIMQMLPQFWSSVRVPIPFDEAATKNQIHQAAAFLHSLYERFGDWSEALAAYNFGPGNEEKYLEHKIKGLPLETINYVSEILADVHVPSGAKA